MDSYVYSRMVLDKVQYNSLIRGVAGKKRNEQT